MDRGMNKLFYGDNLTIMKKMPLESVDLIYLDPPFNSNRSYNLLYKNTTGLPIPEQIEAFCDTWELDYEKSELAYDIPHIMQAYGINADLMDFWHYMVQALKNTDGKMLAYLVYMTIRLLEMYRILKQTGSIFLHCDPTASHYLKIILDGIFGRKQFRNEIIWHYSGWNKKLNQKFESRHDTILFYAKSDNAEHFAGFAIPWNSEDEYIRKRKQKVLIDENGEKYVMSDAGGGNRIKRYVKDAMQYGSPIDDVWDIDKINNSSKEKLGYPTQKPLALLERIIKSASNENDVIFDPFCGCGTTIEASIRNNRQWIGCDIAIHSIKLIQETRIKKYSLTEGADYTIDGVPQSTEQAHYLFEQDPFQFQHWAIEKTGGFCSNKKTGDRGIDGKIYFEADKKLSAMVLSVKGGNIKPADIRDLRGVLERERDVAMAGFISLQKPTKAMAQEADEAGYYEYQGVRYPRIQLLTVADIFEGKQWRCPSVVKAKRKDLGQAYLSL
jgi:site-specific DNA-methyltransferase (adenine-specific)